MGQLKPRSLPQRGGYSIPYSEIRENTYQLFAELERAADRLVLESRDSTPKEESLIVRLPQSVFDVQLYSRAVQVFAPMAVEAALNAYGLMRFGLEEFEAYERSVRPGPRRKLRDLLDHEYARRPAPDDAIVLALGRLVDRRNALVHQRSDESLTDGEGRLTFTTPINRPPLTYEAAKEALHDMEVFFIEFPRCDTDTEMFFLLTRPLRSSPARLDEQDSRKPSPGR